MTKAPATYTPGQPGSAAHVHTTYEGTTEVYSPSTTHPGASSYVPFSCGHTNHPTYTDAERCVERRARTHTANLNREAAAKLAQVPCRYAIHEEQPGHDEPTHYMRMCTSHHHIAGTLYPQRETAETTQWACPWEKLAGYSPDPAPVPIGTRVEVIEHPYGQYQGDTGTVVPEPPEMARFPDIDFTRTTWVRLDFQDGRTPAVGFDERAVLRVLDAAVTV
jgi:hypothetical protein